MPNIQFQIQKLKEFIRKEGLITKDKQKIISSAGREEDWLFDLRNVFLEPEPLDLIAEIFWHNFGKEYPFQVGGQEVAAIPLVTAIIMKSRQMGKPVNGFIIRKSRKPTGLQKIIEGNFTDGKIILVDDLINSGTTALRQIKIIENSSQKVNSFFTLINFRGKKNTELLEKKQVRLFSLFSPEDFGLSSKEEKIPEENFKAVWRFQSPDPSYFWIIPKSAPYLDEEKVYFGSDSGYFWALEQKDGAVSWKFKCGYTPPGKGIFSSPAVHEDKVYFGAYDGNVYALDKNNGEIKWKFREADWVGSSPAVAADLGLLFIGLEFGLFTKRGGIAALDLETGKKIWDYRMTNFVHSSPAYCPERRLVATGCNDYHAYLFDAKKGKLKWKFETGGVIRDSLAFNLEKNLVLFGSYDNFVYAVDIDSGELRGKYETGDIIYSTPKVHEENVYFASTDKNLYSVNLKTGALNWRFTAGGRIFSSPQVIGSKILFGANDGKLYEIDSRTGKCVSFFQATERITSRVAHNPKTGRYFLSTYANELYCLEKPES